MRGPSIMSCSSQQALRMSSFRKTRNENTSQEKYKYAWDNVYHFKTVNTAPQWQFTNSSNSMFLSSALLQSETESTALCSVRDCHGCMCSLAGWLHAISGCSHYPRVLASLSGFSGWLCSRTYWQVPNSDAKERHAGLHSQEDTLAMGQD